MPQLSFIYGCETFHFHFWKLLGISENYASMVYFMITFLYSNSFMYYTSISVWIVSIFEYRPIGDLNLNFLNLVYKWFLAEVLKIEIDCEIFLTWELI
jgi:hypothetical protein